MGHQIERLLAAEPEIALISARLGNEFEDTNVASFCVRLVPAGERSRSTAQMMSAIRTLLADWDHSQPMRRSTPAQ